MLIGAACIRRFDVRFESEIHWRNAATNAAIDSNLSARFDDILVTGYLNKVYRGQDLQFHSQVGNSLSGVTLTVSARSPECRFTKTFKPRVRLDLSAGATLGLKASRGRPGGLFQLSLEPDDDPDLGSLCKSLQGTTLASFSGWRFGCDDVIPGSGDKCTTTLPPGFHLSVSGPGLDASTEFSTTQRLGDLSFPLNRLWAGKDLEIKASTTYVPNTGGLAHLNRAAAVPASGVAADADLSFDSLPVERIVPINGEKTKTLTIIKYQTKPRKRAKVGFVKAADGRCPASKALCSWEFRVGQKVPVRAGNAGDWRFSSWAGACKGKKRTCWVTMNSSRTVKAYFAPKPLKPITCPECEKQINTFIFDREVDKFSKGKCPAGKKWVAYPNYSVELNPKAALQGKVKVDIPAGSDKEFTKDIEFTDKRFTKFAGEGWYAVVACFDPDPDARTWWVRSVVPASAEIPETEQINADGLYGDDGVWGIFNWINIVTGKTEEMQRWNFGLCPQRGKPAVSAGWDNASGRLKVGYLTDWYFMAGPTAIGSKSLRVCKLYYRGTSYPNVKVNQVVEYAAISPSSPRCIPGFGPKSTPGTADKKLGNINFQANFQDEDILGNPIGDPTLHAFSGAMRLISRLSAYDVVPLKRFGGGCFR